MYQGFLGTRASLIPDLLVVALVIVLPAFFYGVALARKGRSRRHAAIMSSVFSVLFVAVIAFTIWNKVWNTSVPPIKDSPLYDSFYVPFTIGHIIIAVSGVLLGLFVVVTASIWRRPDKQGELVFDSASHRKIHIVTGKIALTLYVLISLSGLVIYYLRYVYVPPG